MCKWGTDTMVRVKLPADLSHTGEERWAVKGIDSCIAPIVKALQDAGIDMLGSCCGHDKTPGEIILADGRTLRVTTDALSVCGACRDGGMSFDCAGNDLRGEHLAC